MAYVVEQQPSPYGFTNPSAGDFKSAQPGPSWGQPQNAVSPAVIITDANDVPNYQIWSILNIIFCCWILGCVACYFSCETDSSKERGDVVGALNASRSARTFNIVSTILGVIININAIFYFAGVY